MRSRTLILLVPLVLLLLASLGDAQVKTLVPLPADLQGQLNGVPYRIRVPANWNGTLLVYAYGYAEAVDSPLAPPDADIESILAKGFALAGVHAAGAVPIPGAATDAGWNVQQRMQNTAALTSAFRYMVGQPRRTIMWGRSMGALVTLAMIEKFPGLFDGAVALCSPGAGTPRMFDTKVDVALAYAVAFGWNEAWGTPGAPRTDLNFITEIYPYVMQQATPDKKGLWEFIRLVNKIPYDSSFYGPVNFRFQLLWLALAPQSDIIVRAGGPVAQNLDRVYTLTDDEKSYLSTTFGLNADPLLAAMNEKRIYNFSRNARNYVEHYFNPTGRITGPIITLHTTGDAAVIPQNEDAYRKTVEARGLGPLLMQAYSKGNGIVNTHCTFTPAQYLSAIDAMVNWLDTGTRPDPSVYFPEAMGFDPDYVPEQWPY